MGKLHASSFLCDVEAHGGFPQGERAQGIHHAPGRAHSTQRAPYPDVGIQQQVNRRRASQIVFSARGRNNVAVDPVRAGGLTIASACCGWEPARPQPKRVTKGGLLDLRVFSITAGQEALNFEMAISSMYLYPTIP